MCGVYYVLTIGHTARIACIQYEQIYTFFLLLVVCAVDVHVDREVYTDN